MGIIRVGQANIKINDNHPTEPEGFNSFSSNFNPETASLNQDFVWGFEFHDLCFSLF